MREHDEFIDASAENLSAITTESIDIVHNPGVLILVWDKPRGRPDQGCGRNP